MDIKNRTSEDVNAGPPGKNIQNGNKKLHQLRGQLETNRNNNGTMESVPCG